jgi:hypothetical protein
MIRSCLYRYAEKVLLVLLVLTCNQLSAQITPTSASTDSIPPMPSYTERSKNWGPNDTITVDAIWYNREMMSYKEESMVWVSNLSAKKLEKYVAEWTRLRNAVYVT